MTAEQFAKRFSLLLPSYERLHDFCERFFDKDRTEINIKRLEEYFRCYKYGECAQVDPLFQLAECYYMEGVYNVTNISFRDIEDLELQNPDLKYYQWGNYETPDMFIKLKSTGEIGFVMWGDMKNILYVAESSEKFLDALLEMCDIREKLTIDNMEAMDVLNRKQAHKCALLAGGDKYLDFYLKHFENRAPYRSV